MNVSNEIQANRENWNQRTAIHVDSDFYELDAFKRGKNSLRQLELEELGEVKANSLLHLQCHFGMDTLSWARLGAKVTGIDFSDTAIEQARKLAAELEIPAQFILSDVYNAPVVHQEKYDIVFTSYGTIGWLPDLDRWAAVIKHFLKPGGSFYIADFHPVVWMFDDDFKGVAYSYFNDGPDFELSEGTYADRASEVNGGTYNWSHSISEIVMALKNAGLELEFLHEHNYINWNCLNGLEKIGPYRYILPKWGHKAPYMYSIMARMPRE
ncbi:MAG: class I SAM-dependent methyltransferase [Bacteroidota bacterium]